MKFKNWVCLFFIQWIMGCLSSHIHFPQLRIFQHYHTHVHFNLCPTQVECIQQIIRERYPEWEISPIAIRKADSPKHVVSLHIYNYSLSLQENTRCEIFTYGKSKEGEMRPFLLEECSHAGMQRSTSLITCDAPHFIHAFAKGANIDFELKYDPLQTRPFSMVSHLTGEVDAAVVATMNDVRPNAVAKTPTTIYQLRFKYRDWEFGVADIHSIYYFPPFVPPAKRTLT